MMMLRLGPFLTTQSKTGSCLLQVWKIRTGQCLRRFDAAHMEGVTAVSLSRYNCNGSWSGFQLAPTLEPFADQAMLQTQKIRFRAV